jgi:TfoX/Sxy family transcriptional regulator of competence genes
MAYDEGLADRVRVILGQAGPFEERKMFGGLCFMRKDRMCCGVLRDDLVIKVAPERAAEAAQEPHVRPMDLTGRPMPEMLYVAPEAIREDASLRRWVVMTIEFTDGLPPKEAKQKKPSRRTVARRS